MLEHLPHGKLEWQVDHNRRVLFTRWVGDLTGADLMATLPRIWTGRPELTGFGGVHDQFDFTGIIEHTYYPELRRLWVEFCGNPDALNRTGVVTGNAMKLLELKVLNASAPAEQVYRVFGSNAEALRWVTADEPDNPSAGGRDLGELPWWFSRTA